MSVCRGIQDGYSKSRFLVPMGKFFDHEEFVIPMCDILDFAI
jgi:hypothetical protein